MTGIFLFGFGVAVYKNTTWHDFCVEVRWDRGGRSYIKCYYPFWD